MRILESLNRKVPWWQYPISTAPKQAIKIDACLRCPVPPKAANPSDHAALGRRIHGRPKTAPSPSGMLKYLSSRPRQPSNIDAFLLVRLLQTQALTWSECSFSGLPDRSNHHTTHSEAPVPMDLDPAAPPLDHPSIHDDEWVDESDNESAIVQHYLQEKCSHPFRSKLPADYCSRSATERKNWQDQEQLLAQAFMAWKAKGPSTEGSEHSATDPSFSCNIISTCGKCCILSPTNKLT